MGQPKGRQSVYSGNTRKTWDTLVPQTHYITNGIPSSRPKMSGPNRTLGILQSRIDSIYRAIQDKKR